MVWQVRDNYLILVERPTVKSGAMHVRLSGVARDLSSGVDFLCRLSYGVRTAPNSKHWFTTSFFQPLPYLVTP